MANPITVNRSQTGSKIFHVKVVLDTKPEPTLANLAFGEVAIGSSNPSVVKVFAIGESGQPITHANDGAFAVVYSSKTGASKSGRFIMLFTQDGQARVNVGVRPRLETPNSTAGNFTGLSYTDSIDVTVVSNSSANPEPKDPPAIIGIRIVEGEPSL